MPAGFRGIKKYCEHCGILLKLNSSRDIHRKRFCSRNCLALQMRKEGKLFGQEHTHTQKTKEKMRKSKIELLATGWIPLGWRKYSPKLRISVHHGYKFLGTKREHRLLIEKELGRNLSFDEVVHHKDLNKLNNSINNLIVMMRAEHTKLHDRLRWELVNA